MRVTVDTNVLISFLIVTGGSADQVIQLVREGEIEMVLSKFILDELARVLTQKFELPAKAVQSAVDRFQRLAIMVEPRAVVNVIKEKQDDNRILECAVAGRVDYLITGDKKHILPLVSIQGIPIVGVAEFLQKHRPGL
jgi:putative PIN family toxin of toxin-antitoxin system